MLRKGDNKFNNNFTARKLQYIQVFTRGIIPAAFGPIVDRSDGAARGSILYKHEPVGRGFIQYRTERWRYYAI